MILFAQFLNIKKRGNIMPFPLLIPLIAIAATSTTATVSTGAIVGGVVAGVGGTAATGSGIWYLFFKKRAPKKLEQSIQSVEEHISYINTTIKKIKSYYPWLVTESAIPNINCQEMIDLCDALKVYYDDHQSTYETYKNNFLARVNAIKVKKLVIGEERAPNYHLIQQHFMEDAQALLKCFEKYKFQINTRRAELFNSESVCSKEASTISGYLKTFEKNLSELSNLTLNIPLVLGGKSQFFSLGHYLSELPKQYKSKTDEIKLIQKIAEHHECTEQMRIELIQLLIDKLTSQTTTTQTSRLLLLLRSAKEYTSSLNEGISDGALNIACQMGLTNPNDLPKKNQIGLSRTENEDIKCQLVTKLLQQYPRLKTR
jgi:hypothetical protein